MSIKDQLEIPKTSGQWRQWARWTIGILCVGALAASPIVDFFKEKEVFARSDSTVMIATTDLRDFYSKLGEVHGVINVIMKDQQNLIALNSALNATQAVAENNYNSLVLEVREIGDIATLSLSEVKELKECVREAGIKVTEK